MEQILKVNKALGAIFNEDDYHLVGGCVRDAFMGDTPKDYDICGPLLPEAVVSIAKGAGLKTFNVNGAEFGTISFFIEVDGGKIPIEYTTYRSEVYTSKSRKPEVEFVTSLDEDLARRDFTMNSMVLRSDGSIHDKHGGKFDIYKKQIVTVGLPKERILEDPLRIFRAARFAARYGFEIDHNFIGKARQLADRVFDVSVERWVIEMDKLLTSEHPEIGIKYLNEMGVMQRILPELGGTIPLMPKTGDPDEAWASLLSYNLIFAEVVKEPSRARRFVNAGICSRFKFSNDRRDFILDKVKKKE